MKVTELLEEKKDVKAGVDEINKLVEPIFGSKLKADIETPVSLEVAQKLNRALKQAGYEAETHGSTRAGKKVGTISTVQAKSCPDVFFSVRTFKDKSHIFITVPYLTKESKEVLEDVSNVSLNRDLAGKTKSEVTAYMKSKGFTKFKSPGETKDEASYRGTGFPAYVSAYFFRDGTFNRAVTSS